MSTTILALAASPNLGISRKYAIGSSPCQNEKRRTQPSAGLGSGLLEGYQLESSDDVNRPVSASYS